jgi:hypothetical protein
VIRTQDAGLKIGTETTGDIHDVLFERCKIISSSRGLCIQLRDEGDVSNITFRDIQFVSRYHSDPWWGRGEAISVTAIPRNAGTKLGKLHDILVQNVSGKAENSVRINGSPTSRIENVSLKNVAVNLSRWTKYSGGVYDNRPTKVFEPIERHDPDGFNLRWANQVSLSHCSAKWPANRRGNFRNAIAVQDVTALQIWKFEGDSAAHPIVMK